MPFDSKLMQGQVLTNEEICEIFKCSSQGGLRRSRKTNSLVLISYHNNTLFEDRWEDGIFHYAGMGLEGDQSIEFAQNRTLAESDSNNINLFLFEVFESGKYVYQGRVHLDGSPYKEKQLDKKGKIRDVWIFPLRLADGNHPVIIPEGIFQKDLSHKKRRASKLSDKELKKRIDIAPPKSGSREVISKNYYTSQVVAEFVQRRANGICQLCGQKAPFIDKKGRPYLEVHHVKWLSKGGKDTKDNSVALCPNCHKKMHELDLKRDKNYLRRKLLDFKMRENQLPLWSDHDKSR